MKNFILTLLSVFFIGLMGSEAANAVADYQVINPVDGAILWSITGFSVAVFNYVTPFLPKGALFALQKEVWINDIMENLFNGMEFVTNSVDDSSYVTNKTVHVPQAGTAPAVTKNRAVFPASITERTDTELTYNIDNYTTDPILVRNFDEVQISYAKRQSIMGEHQSKLSERMGDEMAFNWSPTTDAALVLRTTGANTSELANATTTGTRLRITKEDVARMAKKLDRDNAPKDGRFLLLDPTMFYELFEIDALVNKNYMDNSALPKGVIRELFGFNIMMRNVVTTFNSAAAGVLKAVGAADAATDCRGALAWSKYFVRRALGGIDVYLNEDRAEYYGSILSAEVNFGGKKSRTDNKGIVALAQGVGA